MGRWALIINVILFLNLRKVFQKENLIIILHAKVLLVDKFFMIVYNFDFSFLAICIFLEFSIKGNSMCKKKLPLDLGIKRQQMWLYLFMLFAKLSLFRSFRFGTVCLCQAGSILFYMREALLHGRVCLSVNLFLRLKGRGVFWQGTLLFV